MTRSMLAIAAMVACSSPIDPTAASPPLSVHQSNSDKPVGVRKLDKKQLRQAYERYLVAWSAVPQAQRIRILDETLSPDIQYLDAMTKGVGMGHLADHLAAFQERRKGYSFTLGSLLTFGDEVLAKWEMRDSAGAIVVRGFDVLHIDADGKISSITGFSDVDQMRA